MRSIIDKSVYLKYIFISPNKIIGPLSHYKFDFKNCEDNQELYDLITSSGASCIGISRKAPNGAFPGSAGIFNPYDHKLTAGGSTSGGGVSVAIGESDFSIGSDAGGSIRIPASFCGLYGYMMERSINPVQTQTAIWSGFMTRSLNTLQKIMYVIAPSYINPMYSPNERLKILIVSDLTPGIEIIPGFPEINLDGPILSTWKDFTLSLKLEEAQLIYTQSPLPNIAQSFLVKWIDAFKGSGSSPLNGEINDLTLNDDQTMYKYIHGPRQYYSDRWADMLQSAKKDLKEALHIMNNLFDQFDIILTPTVLCNPWPQEFCCPTFSPELTKELSLAPNLIDSRFNPYLVLANIVPNSLAMVCPTGSKHLNIPLSYHLMTRTTSIPGEATNKLFYFLKNVKH